MLNDIFRSLDAFMKKAEVYTVQKGDTYEKISKNHPMAVKNNVLVKEIEQANPGVSPARLQIGQTIVIPVGDMLSDIRSKNEAPRSSAQDNLVSQIDQAFTAAASANGVSEPVLRGIAMVESGGDICAKSGSGAVGLMQLMPAIQREYGVSDPLDPVSSIWGAARHLSKMMAAAGQILQYYPEGNVEKVALTMYNLGESAYREAIRAGKSIPQESAQYADKVFAALGAKPAYHCNKSLV